MAPKFKKPYACVEKNNLPNLLLSHLFVVTTINAFKSRFVE
jgi:hypothetical protein